MMKTKVTGIRLTNEEIKRLDRVVERFKKEYPGVRYTRASIIRYFLISGLEKDEKENNKIQ